MLQRIIGLLIALLLFFLRLTLRIKVYGDDLRLQAQTMCSDRPPLHAVLHGHQMSLIAFNFYRDFGVITSRSRDGEIAASVLRFFGMVPIRGSSSRGGKEALAGAYEHVMANKALGITVDGPRGPRGQVKRGICELARQSGLAIVPSVAVPAWRIELRSWDRFQIPLPFTRLIVIFGQPLLVPNSASPEQVFAYCDQLASALSELEKKALMLADA